MVYEEYKIISHKLSPFAIVIDKANHCPSHYGLSERMIKEDCCFPIDCEMCWNNAFNEIESFEVIIHKKNRMTEQTQIPITKEVVEISTEFIE